MSPAPDRRGPPTPAARPTCSQPSIVPAMRAASRTTGEDALASSSGDQGSARSTGSRLLGRPDLDQPGVAGAMRDVRDRLGRDVQRPACAPASAKMRSTACQQRLRPSGTTASAARAATAGRRARRGAANAVADRRRTCSAPRPGSRRSTASRRRRRTACAPPRARRCRRRTPRPARGSPATAPGSCPAPRRPGCGRARRRACRAPIRPPPTSRAGSRPWPTRSSKSSAARRALASRVALHARRCRAGAAPSSRRAAASLQPLRVQRDERVLRPRQQRMRVGMRGRQRPWSAAFLRGSPSVGEEDARAERRCGRAGRRPAARPRCARRPSMSLAEPDARTPRSRAQLRVGQQRRRARSSRSSMRTSGAQPDGRCGRSSPPRRSRHRRRRRAARRRRASRCSRKRLGEQLVEIAVGGIGRRPSASASASGVPGVAGRLGQHLVGRLAPAARRRSCSSRMAKPGGTPASSGKRCSRRSQKAWMVCTLRPPGVSMAMAKSCRARCISGRRRRRGRAARRAWPSSSASSAVTHSASRANTRLDISAAAALV